MNGLWVIARREIRSYFDSPVGYVVLTLFLLLSGWFFSSGLFLQGVASIRVLFDMTFILFMFFIPAITMGSFAEERRAGTLELLLTMPIKDWQVIGGKLLAAFLLLCSAIALTFTYGIIVAFLGDIDAGAAISGYFGMALLGLACASIGIFSSSLTRNQVVAFIIAFVIIFVLFMIDKVTVFLPGSMAAALQYLSLDFHYQNLLRGVVDSRDILYFLSVVVFSSVATAYHLSKRPE
jgi:ABC-2 type transport system permease protein